MLAAAVPSPNTLLAVEPRVLLKEGLDPNDAAPPNAGVPPKDGGLPNTVLPPKPSRLGNKCLKINKELIGSKYFKRDKKKLINLHSLHPKVC